MHTYTNTHTNAHTTSVDHTASLIRLGSPQRTAMAICFVWPQWISWILKTGARLYLLYSVIAATCPWWSHLNCCCNFNWCHACALAPCSTKSTSTSVFRHGTLHGYLPVEDNIKCSLSNSRNPIERRHASQDTVSRLQKRLNEVERWQ